MYEVKYTSKFKRDYKLIQKQGKDMSKLRDVIGMLQNGIELPERYRDHTLSGKYEGCRECHIESDWLLIYYINKSNLILYLTRTGSHASLLNM